MKSYVVLATNWESGLVTHVGIFPADEADQAIMIAFEKLPPFTSLHKEEVKYYDKAQKLRETIDARLAAQAAQ